MIALNTGIDPDQLLTRKQAAKRLGIKDNTLAVWSCYKRYNLPCYKIGRCVKYKLSDIEAFISKNQQGAGNKDV